jgi:hypothetical protein
MLVKDRVMYGRIRSIVLGAVLILLADLPALRTRADDKGHEAHAAHFDHCAKACTECMRECESCARHCVRLVADGKRDHLKTVGTCSDCAELCAAAAKITSHQGPMAVLVCEACAKACDSCGTECEKFPEDEHMKRCATACRECATACREMVEMIGKESAAN